MFMIVYECCMLYDVNANSGDGALVPVELMEVSVSSVYVPVCLV